MNKFLNRTPIIITAVGTLFFLAVLMYMKWYGDGGADGLSMFFPMVLTGLACIGFLMVFLGVLIFTNKGDFKFKLLAFALVMAPLGYVLATMFHSTRIEDYEQVVQEVIEEDKAFLETKTYESTALGILFSHVSGNVGRYNDGKPEITPITPKMENGMLTIPVDDESYYDSDYILKVSKPDSISVGQYVDRLVKELSLKKIFFSNDSSTFTHLPDDVEILVSKIQGVPLEEKLILANYFNPVYEHTPDLIFFIQSPKQPDGVVVILISGQSMSAPAIVENMTSNDFRNKNLWYHTLEFLD